MREEEVLEPFRVSSRIALINVGESRSAINAVKEMIADLGARTPRRPSFLASRKQVRACSLITA